MGQLMKYMGPDRILFGSDSVWYGVFRVDGTLRAAPATVLEQALGETR